MRIQIQVAFHPIAIGFDFILPLGGMMTCLCDLPRIHGKKMKLSVYP
jgi:hypothetical protein